MLVLYRPSDLKSKDRKLKRGGASVLVNGAVFKTVSETARAGSGRFDSYTPPPTDCRIRIADCRSRELRLTTQEDSHYGCRTDESANSCLCVACDSIGREFAQNADRQRSKKSDASLRTVCWRKLSSCLPS